MDGGPKALLEVWKASLDPFSGSFGYKGQTELVKFSIQIYAIGGKIDVLPSAPGVGEGRAIDFLESVRPGSAYLSQ
jgi:hypothetical protein